jgi:hypothetical protein
MIYAFACRYYDQSQKIFKVAKLDELKSAVDIAVDESKPELRSEWKAFLEHYVLAIETLTKSLEYEPEDIEELEHNIDVAYVKLMAIAGIQGVTNYFHYLGSGHIVWLIRIYGNIWRYRNEGVEGLNGTLSLRYNKFNNKGGNKGSSKNKSDVPNGKCRAFEVLGSWMARLCMWQLGLGMLLFDAKCEIAGLKRTKVVKWHTGTRIVYDRNKSEEALVTDNPGNVSDTDDSVEDADSDDSLTDNDEVDDCNEDDFSDTDYDDDSFL